MKAGEYWVGDLCYVLDDVWLEVCDLTLDGEEGEFTLKDGRKFALFNTAYGDGCYPDNLGNMYGVDSGTIGCIAVSDLNGISTLGHVHEFKEGFKPYVNFEMVKGYKYEYKIHEIMFGPLVITTYNDDAESRDDMIEDDD